MTELAWNRCVLPPRDHQKEGVRILTGVDRRKRVNPNVFLLADEVGAGKTKQVVDASQFLFEDGDVDTVLAVCPGFARSVWLSPDPVLGEVAKHAWSSRENVIHEFHADTPKIAYEPRALNWVVTNYEFIRRPDRLRQLLPQLRGRKVYLALDEAWSVKSHKAAQTQACEALRAASRRVVLLDGSPVDGSPLDLFSKFWIMDPSIIGSKNYFHFRARYAIMGGFERKQIVGWQNLEELMDKVAPYIRRALTRECFDLPEELEPITLEARLSDATWRIYRSMRDEMVAWLDSGEVSVAQQAIVKALRLCQITSGYLGGVASADANGFLDFEGGSVPGIPSAPKEIGREKLDTMHQWLATIPQPDRLLVWCRFRSELDRIHDSLAADRQMFKLQGGQKPAEREAAKRALAPDTVIDGPVGVVGNPSAGGAALNFSGAPLAITVSQDWNLKTKKQKDGRIARPGQVNRYRYVDIVAVGPKGQKTVDHLVLKALREKDDMALWSAARWRKALLDE